MQVVEEVEEEGDGFPVEITCNGPLPLAQLSCGAAFVETDFRTTIGTSVVQQWYECVHVLTQETEHFQKDVDMRSRWRERGWDCREYVVLTDDHLLVVRMWCNARPGSGRQQGSGGSERYLNRAKAAKAIAAKRATAAAKRFGRWMSSLKSPTGENSGSVGSSSSSGGVGGGVDGDGVRRGSFGDDDMTTTRNSTDTTTQEPSSPSSPRVVRAVSEETGVYADGSRVVSSDDGGGYENPVALPTVVSVERRQPLLNISRMTRKKKNPNVLTLYFGDDISILCSFEDPTDCTLALKKRCLDIKKRAEEQQPQQQQQQQQRPSLSDVTVAVTENAVDAALPNSPQADSTAFSFGGDTSEEESEDDIDHGGEDKGGEGIVEVEEENGHKEDGENPFDWDL